MKKKAAVVFAILFFASIAVIGGLVWMLMVQKEENLALEDKNDRLKEQAEETQEEYEKRLSSEKAVYDAEKNELIRENAALSGELADTQVSLNEALSVVPAEKNYEIREDVGRVYQQGCYQDFAAQNDNYDTKQYTYSIIYAYPTDVVFAGDSLVERCSWSELYPELDVKNRGIGGDTVMGLKARMDTVMLTQPEKVFISVGINDVLFEREVDDIINRFNELLTECQNYECEFYVQSIMPVSASQADAERILLDSHAVNEGVEDLCAQKGITYINMWDEFAGDDWALLPEYYYDGVHVNGSAYRKWKELLDPYVYN